MKNKWISIIVPIYNTEEYLKRCISSILSQTYEYLEVILVDDGSTDCSGDICDFFAKKDERIRVCHKANGGNVLARKTGLAMAGGDYAGFVDSDDYIEKTMFEVLFNHIEQTNSDFVHSGYWVGEKKHMCFDSQVFEIEGRREQEEFLKDYILDYESSKRISPSIWSKLFKRRLIAESFEAVPDAQYVGEDWIVLTECAMRSQRISLVGEAGYHYTKRENSLSHAKDMEDLLWQSGLYMAMRNVLKRHGYYEAEKRWLDNAFKSLLFHSLKKNINHDFAMTPYLYRDVSGILGKNIVLYGAGAVGTSYYAQLCRYPACRIVAWVDSHYEKFHYDCREVVDKGVMKGLEYDFVILGVKRKENAFAIRKMLEKDGVESSKILWSPPVDLCLV